MKPTKELLIDENGKGETLLSEKKEFIIQDSESVKATVNELVFLGYEDRTFAKASFDFKKEKVHIQIRSGMPHQSFQSAYAVIVVKDNSDEQRTIYSKTLIGNQECIEEDTELDFKDGYRILTYHAEANNKLFLYDKHGHLLSMISKYNDFMKSREDLIKINYSIEFLGVNETIFASVNFNLMQEKLSVQFEEGRPFELLGNMDYAKINVFNDANHLIYSEKFEGNSFNKVHEDIVEFRENYKIKVEHLEYTKLKIYIDDRLFILHESKPYEFTVVNQKLVPTL